MSAGRPSAGTRPAGRTPGRERCRRPPTAQAVRRFRPHHLSNSGNQQVRGPAAARIRADPHGHQFPFGRRARLAVAAPADHGDQANRLIFAPGDEVGRTRGTPSPLGLAKGHFARRSRAERRRGVRKGRQPHCAQEGPLRWPYSTDPDRSHPLLRFLQYADATPMLTRYPAQLPRSWCPGRSTTRPRTVWPRRAPRGKRAVRPHRSGCGQERLR